MAGDWIKMRHDLADDPAVIAMAGATGICEDTVVGVLHRLWSWADRHTTDGYVTCVTKSWIDRFVRHPGFVDAMISVGWLSLSEQGANFPRFDRHNGQSAKQRALTKDRMVKMRDADGVTEASLEKKREEKKEEEQPTSSFLRFWDAYPPGPGGRRRVDKRGCFRTWNANNLEAEAEAVIAHVTSMAKCADWTKDGGQYVPMTKTYLNQRRWDVAAPRNPVNQQQQFFNRGPRL
jgi:hypothetical protein